MPSATTNTPRLSSASAKKLSSLPERTIPTSERAPTASCPRSAPDLEENHEHPGAGGAEGNHERDHRGASLLLVGDLHLRDHDRLVGLWSRRRRSRRGC